MSKKTQALKVIQEEIVALAGSPLYEYRIQEGNFPVIGEGNPDASIILIGEAPGRNEAKTGRPFVGAAGKVLNELLQHAGILRDEVYITNIVKDRPPQNRDPLPEEIALYGPFLDRQIEIIKPRVLATLGRYPMQYVMKRFGLEKELLPIGALHGTVHKAKANYGEVLIVPLYHPAAAIYDRSKLEVLRKDFMILKAFA